MTTPAAHVKRLKWLGKMLLDNEMFLPVDSKDITETLSTLEWAIEKVAPKKGKESKSAGIWLAYRRGYVARYGHEPLMNASVRAMLCKIVDFVGKDHAPDLATYYLRLNKPFYVTNHHPINLLVKDYQSVYTQMMNQTDQTTSDVRQVERRAALSNAAESIKDKISRGEI